MKALFTALTLLLAAPASFAADAPVNNADFAAQAKAAEEQAKRIAYRRVVIDDENSQLRVHVDS